MAKCPGQTLTLGSSAEQAQFRLYARFAVRSRARRESIHRGIERLAVKLFSHDKRLRVWPWAGISRV